MFINMRHPGGGPANNRGSASSSSAARPTLLRPQQRLEESLIDMALFDWHRYIIKSMDSCELMKEKLEHFETDDLDARLGLPVSLLLRTDTSGDGSNSYSISFVSWVKPYRDMQGRCVQLDEDDCIMYPSHFRPKESFKGSVFILPGIGACSQE